MQRLWGQSTPRPVWCYTYLFPMTPTSAQHHWQIQKTYPSKSICWEHNHQCSISYHSFDNTFSPLSNVSVIELNTFWVNGWMVASNVVLEDILHVLCDYTGITVNNGLWYLSGFNGISWYKWDEITIGIGGALYLLHWQCNIGLCVWEFNKGDSHQEYATLGRISPLREARSPSLP